MTHNLTNTGALRRFMTRTLFVGALFCAPPAYAQNYEEIVLAQLQSQGFGQITIERTLLGRVRIFAVQNGRLREIVLNPRTGEVLRDVKLSRDASAAYLATSGKAAASKASGGQSSNSRDDDSAADDASGDDDKNDDSGDDSNDGGGDNDSSDDGGDDDGGDDDGDDGGGDDGDDND